MTGNIQVFLAARPSGVPQPRDFGLRDGDLPVMQPGQVLVRNHYLSVDPAMRGWICNSDNYAPQIQVDEVVRALAVGEVVASKTAGLPVGTFVMGMFGWQEYAAASPQDIWLRVEDRSVPLSAYLGVLGLNGLTAYFGLLETARAKAGDTVVVSSAAGSVGSCVGQIAKLKGCRTVGIAGGADKVRLCLEEFGYDAALDYKAGDGLQERLRQVCPQGVDIYFDNTSGLVSDAVLGEIAQGARIVICGTAAASDPTGPRPQRRLLVKRARMEGFLVTDHATRYPEALEALAGWVRDGSLKYREDVLDGIAQAPGGLQRLYAGANTGKLIIRLAAGGAPAP